MTNPKQIVREFQVYDGKLLDYALKDENNDQPVIFVEAKALKKSLKDPSFIAQTVNYANNEGVRWCVLANGRTYRIYRSVEPVPMERKMLVEVDLIDKERDATEIARSLRPITWDFTTSGQLEKWGQTVFIDVKVREVLRSLHESPSTAFLNAVANALPKESKVAKPELIDSLKSIGVQQFGQALTPIWMHPAQDGSTKVTGEDNQPSLDRHLAGKPTQIRNLYEALHTQVMALGGDVTRRIKRYYINYLIRNSFTTVDPMVSFIKVHISVPVSAIADRDQDIFRDVTKVGIHGLGNVEARLSEEGQLDEIMELVSQAYELSHKPAK